MKHIAIGQKMVTEKGKIWLTSPCENLRNIEQNIKTLKNTKTLIALWPVLVSQQK